MNPSADVDEDLTFPIILSDRILKSIREADSFKCECSDLGRQVQELSSKLRSAIRLAPNSYDRPIRRIFSESAKTLDRALTLVRRCRRSSILLRVVSIATGSADFKKISVLLDASLADLQWLLSVYETADLILSLPPIASTDPILSWVWSYITTLSKPSASPSDRAEAANSLAGLALDNYRNKKILFEEGALRPLLSLLSDSSSSLDAQTAAASALYNLASDREHVSLIVTERAVPIIVRVLGDSLMALQVKVAGLVSRMASFDEIAQEEFAIENAIRPLVSLLSFEVPMESEPPAAAAKKHTSIQSLVKVMTMAPAEAGGSDSIGTRKDTSIHSLVKGMTTPKVAGRDSNGSRSTSLIRDYLHQRKERENESPEVKLALKIACAHALWMLSRNSVANSRKVTETKGLLCLAKIVEREKGELQHHCLMTLMEIAVVAETDDDLRRSAFKTNSPAAKAVVEQLLRMVVQQASAPALQIAAVKAVGSLARTFPARETRVMSPLVVQLGHWNPDVAAEAADALGKFVNAENYLRTEHSKTIIEFGAVPPLIRLVRSGEKPMIPALVLLCYLALNVPDNEALERALGVLESTARTGVSQHHLVRELLPEAICHLELYRVGANIHKDAYAL